MRLAVNDPATAATEPLIDSDQVARGRVLQISLASHLVAADGNKELF
jgi:hypothetical protein